MAERPDWQDPAAAMAAHNLLQQQLITVRARLDRQVAQLIRLNQLSNHLLERMDRRPVAEIFAEAIVDVLDVAVGAVWILPPIDEIARQSFACCGVARAPDAWARLGPALAARLPPNGKTVRLDDSLQALLPGVDFRNALACTCVGRDGRPTAVVLASNTAGVDSMFVSISEETMETLAVLAEKCAAHIDNSVDRRLIERQVGELRDSQQQLELVLRGTNDGWWDWDIPRDRCFLSARWVQMMGGGDAGACTRAGFWQDRVHADDRQAFDERLQRALSGSEPGLEAEVRMRRDDETWMPVLVRGTILRDGSGRAERFAGTVLDLTDRKRFEADIHRLAFFDPLTELPNRRLLLDRLRQSLLVRSRTGQITGVLMLDIDRFKWLNDTHGHAAGDQLLVMLAKRLRELVRPYDTVARLGGDEFVVLLEQLGTDPNHALATAQRVGAKILEAMNEPYTLSVGTVHHSVSVGAVLSVDERSGADAMLRAADVALYQAKQDGRNMLRLFHPDMQARVDVRSALDASLRESFAQSLIHLNYQAQVDEAGSLFGVEALMRWTRPDGTGVPPSDFIQVAEESGFIHTLGGWSLRTACEQVVHWRSRLPSGFRVAVNLSAPEFTRPDFPDRVKEVLARTGARGDEIRLEITERTVVNDLDATIARMRRLEEIGIEFSLDDFGSGNAPLTFLRKLPVREVKIDQDFVRRILHHADDAAMVRAILAMCNALELRVVAEGVETREQWSRLMEDGCRHFQGYLFGRPHPSSHDPGDLVLRPDRARLVP
jgi:diguanylate cyclase (GGDEF)-like protein/PAS domain S-box-containing protein